MRDISWRKRRFPMRTDPSVELRMLSRAFRSLPLVSERSLPLLPTCTLIFFFSFLGSNSILRGHAGRTIILYKYDFPPDFFCKICFSAAAILFPVQWSGENTPYGKRQTSRTKAWSYLQSILEEIKRSPPSCSYYQ